MKCEKKILLKNQKECILRNASGADGREIHDFFNMTHGETDFLLSYPDENSFSVEQESEFLAKKEANPKELEVCAYIDGKLAGMAGIEAVGYKDKVKHRCEFGITVAKEFWGLGIGRALTNACIESARAAGYVQMELNAVADNTSAISLYKSAGFVEYGRNPKGFCSRCTGWQEVVLMRLEL